MNASNKKNFLPIAILIIGLVAIYLYSNISLPRKQKEITPPQESGNVFLPPLPDKIFGIAGKIASKTANSLTLEMNSLKDRRAEDGVLPKERRTVRVSKETTIKELTFSREKLGSSPIERTITLKDLLVGDQIIVTAAENIKEKSVFTASLIQKHLFE